MKNHIVTYHETIRTRACVVCLLEGMSTLLLLMMMIAENHARTRMCGKVNSPVEREREGTPLANQTKHQKLAKEKAGNVSVVTVRRSSIVPHPHENPSSEKALSLIAWPLFLLSGQRSWCLPLVLVRSAIAAAAPRASVTSRFPPLIRTFTS